MIDQEDTGLDKAVAMLLANDLVPDRCHVATVGPERGVEGLAELDATVLQGNGQLVLWGALWPALEDVGLDSWQDLGAEGIGPGEVLVPPFYDLPGYGRVLGFQLQLAPVDVLDALAVDVRDLPAKRAPGLFAASSRPFS